MPIQHAGGEADDANQKFQKFIFVTGGVCSSLGKGIAAASIGAILKAAGFKITMQKLDPYLNVDPGTMSPFQHGEVFVTHDGAETDLDLGHYERFIDENLTQYSSVTTGKIYADIIAKERKGTFLGGTIQIIPHITNAIQERILKVAEKAGAEITIVEIGGTIGDIEGLPYLEAIRQLRRKLGTENTLFVMVTLLPFLQATKELKTKPTQAAVRELREIGIQPDIIIARCDLPIHKDLLKKIALFCDVEEEAVIAAPTVKSIYEVPLNFQKQNIGEIIAQKLSLGKVKPDLKDWEFFVKKIEGNAKELEIAIVGKYTGLEDAYLSVIESLKIACVHHNRKLKLSWIEGEDLENKEHEAWEKLKNAAGIVVPGGFGSRGTEGKILAAKYARENKIPYLGLCLGMQLMTIEFARHVLKNPKITSQEFDEQGNLDPGLYVIHFMPDQYKDKEKGGTMRLGAYPCKIQKGTKTYKLYKDHLKIEGMEKSASGASAQASENRVSWVPDSSEPSLTIEERHRHRYEINNDYRKKLEENGMILSGINPKQNLVEIAEMKDHPFMIGSQFHPEFLSRPAKPHPLFYGFIKACL